MDNIVINIAETYTKTPGGRYIKEGKFSGEDFRINILKPAFEKFISSNSEMTVILDGGFGYAPSFLEEAFGGLVRELNDDRVSQIKIISDEEPKLIDDIKKYISDALEALK